MEQELDAETKQTNAEGLTTKHTNYTKRKSKRRALLGLSPFDH